MIRAFFRLLPFRTWGLIAIALILIALTLAVCSKSGTVERLKDQGTLAGAKSTSALEAIKAIGANADANTQTQAKAKEAQDAILKADPSDRDRIARCELRKLQTGAAAC